MLLFSLDLRCFLPMVCLHQRRVPQFALKYLCAPPPPQGDCHLVTVSPAPSIWGTVARHGERL